MADNKQKEEKKGLFSRLFKKATGCKPKDYRVVK